MRHLPKNAFGDEVDADELRSAFGKNIEIADIHDIAYERPLLIRSRRSKIGDWRAYRPQDQEAVPWATVGSYRRRHVVPQTESTAPQHATIVLRGEAVDFSNTVTHSLARW